MYAARTTVDYLSNLLLGVGYSFESRAFDPAALPLWVGRKVSIAELSTDGGIKFLLVFPETALTAEELIFISRVLKEKKRLSVLVVADDLAPQVRSALTRGRIQTVITGRQLFAPELGIFLNTQWKDSLGKIESVSLHKQAAELSKTARQVLVGVLLKQDSHQSQMRLSEFAKNFCAWIVSTDDSDVTLTILSYLSRAITQLEDLNLVTTLKVGRERKITFHEPSELWAGLCHSTKTTISETALMSEKQFKKIYRHGENCPRSGETALSYYSNLTEPSIPVYALPTGEFNELKTHRHIHSDDEADKKLIKIEHWKADPYFLREKKNVNPIDLALSMRFEKDERVRIELTRLLKKYGLNAEQLWKH